VSIRSFKRSQTRRLDRERRRAATLKRRGLAAGLAIGASGVFAAGAQAATYTVTTNADDAPGGTCAPAPGTCTLRDALTAANADSSADTITFAPGVTSPITLSNGALPISGSGGLTITGPGAGALTVNAGGNSQIFDITAPSSAAVSITGLTLTDGSAPASPATNGGAIIDNSAPLTLSNDTISNSTTPNGEGGGIYANGGLTITNSTLTGDTAPTSYGGAIEAGYNNASVNTISGSTLSNNTARYGGAVGGGRDLAISDTQLTGNHASGSPNAYGGAIQVGDQLELTGSTVTGNTSSGTAGGINVDPKYGATISGATISGNTAAAGGGGMTVRSVGSFDDPVKIDQSTISGNHAPDGAGIYETAADGPVTIQASTLSGNQASGTNSVGGGLLLEGDVLGPFRLVDSTVSGNSAVTGGGVSLGGSYNEPLLPSSHGSTPGSISLANSTIAANAAGSRGGGVYLGEYTAGSPSTEQSGTATISSTIVSGNTAAGSANDLARAATSTDGGFDGSFSLIQTPGSAPFISQNQDIIGKSPELGPLANNGGPTETMLPAGTSPVIDQGHAPDSLTQDQRGEPRTVDTGIVNPPGGDGTDIGSVELPASSVVVPPGPTAGFGATIRGASLGGSGTPLLAGSATPVTCSVKTGTLSSCVIEVRSNGTLIASGEVTASAATSQLTTDVTPTKAGMSMLSHHPLGVTASAKAVGSDSASGTPSVTGNVHLLTGPQFTLPIAKRSKKLSKGVNGELKQIAKLIAGAKTVTCTAYSDKGKHDKSLTKSQAKAACARLTKDGLKGKKRVVGRGHAKPVASNKTAKDRAKNRRLVISFTF
jgi:hypothetical protein